MASPQQRQQEAPAPLCRRRDRTVEYSYLRECRKRELMRGVVDLFEERLRLAFESHDPSSGAPSSSSSSSSSPTSPSCTLCGRGLRGFGSRKIACPCCRGTACASCAAKCRTNLSAIFRPPGGSSCRTPNVEVQLCVACDRAATELGRRRRFSDARERARREDGISPLLSDVAMLREMAEKSLTRAVELVSSMAGTPRDELDENAMFDLRGRLSSVDELLCKIQRSLAEPAVAGTGRLQQNVRITIVDYVAGARARLLALQKKTKALVSRPPVVSSVVPAVCGFAGGSLIKIVGSGFECHETKVYLVSARGDSVPCTVVKSLSASEITIRAPKLPTEFGQAPVGMSIRVVNPDGTADLVHDVLQFVPDSMLADKDVPVVHVSPAPTPRGTLASRSPGPGTTVISGVMPAVCALDGGSVTRLVGENFPREAEIFIGATRVPSSAVMVSEDSSTLSFLAPPMASPGVYGVKVVSSDKRTVASLDDVLMYVAEGVL